MAEGIKESNARMGVNISGRKWDKLAQMFAEGKTDIEISTKLNIPIDKMPDVRKESDRIKAKLDEIFKNIPEYKGE